MNAIVLAQKASDWNRLKALVLDSVSSPITRRVYNLGLNEFFEWYGREPRAGLHERDRQRLACRSGGPWARLDLDQRSDNGRAQAGGRDHAHQGRENEGGPH